MSLLPRVAVGTVQREADGRAILWALIEAFREQSLHVQSFLSRACFAGYHGAASATGFSPRHLDSWLMSAELCREIFIHGAQDCDLALVEGKFASAVAQQSEVGGSLDTLCQWLDLPRVAVLDVSRIESCPLPELPGQADALLLDRVDDGCDLGPLTANLQARWGVPVLGALGQLPELRSEIDAVPMGIRPPRELCQRLGSHLLRHAEPQGVLQLAARRELAQAMPQMFCCDAAVSPLAVALAYDNVFDCYFPDTLDALESRGATIRDFSPLRDERLPPGTDVVYFGCGRPERYAAELSQNHCMKLALRNHLRSGGRMYAEGGGLAYLCQQIELAEGELWRMVGIFPAIAQLTQSQAPPAPVEATLAQETWLGHRGTRLRGYDNPRWRLTPVGPLSGCLEEPDHQYDLVRSCQAIGSRLHLNFAAQPNLLSNFFQPCLLRPAAADPWAAVPSGRPKAENTH
jgi:cobyrinic acid a,c-diamide synthase